MRTQIAPMLAVSDGNAAIEFYKRAFGATLLWRLGDSDVVAGLSIAGAPFFLASEAPAYGTRGPDHAGFTTVRIELFVDDPRGVQQEALAAGAIEHSPVEEHEHSTMGSQPIRRMLQGAVVDPFGHIWLIGKFLALVLIALLSCGSRSFAQGPAGKTDLVLYNAHVVTMNPQQPSAEAIAIRGDRILWVGSAQEAKALARNAARAMDLHGATVLPGIIDAHGHMLSLGQSLVRLNLKGVRTDREAIELVKQKIAGAPANEWIQGWGWDEGEWASHYPNNQELSAVAPNNPVYLVGLHGFATWANKRALQLAGITKDTKDPENGKILRDPSGEPTGILLNHAQELVTRVIPPMTLEQAKQAMLVAARECVRNGLTEVHDAQVTPMMLQAFQELVREKRMPLRLYLMLDGADNAIVEEWLARGPEIDPQHQLTIRAIKLFADGALGSRGAFLLAPYADAPQTRGVVTTSEDAVYDLTLRSLQRGFQVCTHAIGDAANRSVLNAYQRAMRDIHDARPQFLWRLRIEHAQVLAPEDIPRFTKLGVIASMQPVHCTSDMDWAEQRLGPERIKGAYAWRSVVATGAHVPFSSDFPGETLNPFYGIYAAITREDPSGNPPGGWHPEQKVTLEEALRGYTVEAAYAGFEEDAKGVIAPGRLADLTVVNQGVTKVPAREILSISVLQTYVGGKIVYNASATH